MTCVPFSTPRNTPWTKPGFNSCHNCRRRRLRCDRSLPACLKCTSNGEHCLGYGKLFRWTNAVASRGKLAGQTFGDDQPRDHIDGVHEAPPSTVSIRNSASSRTAIGSTLAHYSPLDPLLQDLSLRTRYYVDHFTKSVCKDLVSFDQLHSNPFRYMLPLLGTFDYLREIITATSAVHLATLRRCNGEKPGGELVDALVAKHHAFRLLRVALDNLDSSSRPFVLIAVVFFINFDLIDSGKGGWRMHMQAAGRLISSLQSVEKSSALAIAPLSDMVVADCLTYHILGSTLTSPEEDDGTPFDSIDMLSVLRKAETFSYQCCPPPILQILLLASRLRPGRSAAADGMAMSMIERVRSVDIGGWVYGIQNLSPKDDLDARMRLASAHQAATCLYILLALSLTTEALSNSPDTQALVTEILGHLALVPIDHALAKGTVWPTFMAAAQTDDPERRQWCLQRLQALWRSTPWVCPWGYVETAMDMLQSIWKVQVLDDEASPSERPNWLLRLRGLQDNCLIV